MIGLFAACAKKPDVPVTEATASPFSIYRKEDGYIISIGDKRDDVAQAIGPDEMHVVEFEEYNFERVQYWDNEHIYVDYKSDGTVFAMRFETADWKIHNGLTVGMTPNDVKKLYTAEHIFQFPQTSDLWISYDSDGNTVEFSEQAPFILRFKVQDRKIVMVMIQDNSVRDGIF